MELVKSETEYKLSLEHIRKMVCEQEGFDLDSVRLVPEYESDLDDDGPGYSRPKVSGFRVIVSEK